MFSAKDLTPVQVEQIKVWASEGDQLANIQRKINSDFGISPSVTYLDTRFTLIDLGIELISPDEPEPKKPEETKEKLVPQEYVDATVDKIVRPGYLASGSVVFTDGMKATWGIDQMGKLNVDPQEPGYKVTDADTIAFQELLRDKLQS